MLVSTTATQLMEESGRCWRRAGSFIGSDSDLERLWFTLFGYLNLPSYVASGRENGQSARADYA
jgi:hypothetical protein